MKQLKYSCVYMSKRSYAVQDLQNFGKNKRWSTEPDLYGYLNKQVSIFI